MNDQNAILFEREGAVAYIRLNRPEHLNAITQEMAESLLEICRTISDAPDIRVVVISGEGEAFVAGGDLSQFHSNMAVAPKSAAALLAPLQEALEMMTNAPQVFIASLHGSVVGAGLSLALACDLLIAASNTRFNMAFARIGASPDCSATWSLPRAVGLHKALELALLTETFDAVEAQRLGIVSRVVEPKALAEETNRLVQRLCSGPTFAFGKTKQLMRNSFARTMRDQMEAECAAIEACVGSHDFAEGINAFFEKRQPKYIGY